MPEDKGVSGRIKDMTCGRESGVGLKAPFEVSKSTGREHVPQA